MTYILGVTATALRTSALAAIAKVLARKDQENIASLIPESSSTPSSEAIAKLVEHPLIRDLLVSKDGAHTAVIVQFAGSGQMDLERSAQVEDRIVEAFVAEGWREEDLHLGGMIAALAEIQR